jgi:nitrate/TMAO reductase-like tetraheme cytochrome c subunit
MPAQSVRPKRASLYRNWVTYCGGLLTAGGVILVLMAVLFQYSLRRPSPYVGIITYMVFPSIILLGLIVAGAGMRRESMRRRRLGTTDALPFPSVDLNDPRQRHIFAMILAAGSVLFVVFAFAGYNAFLATESVAFCGSTCHTQMGPEMTASQHSSHARVACVECHVGGGAGPYVASKLSGVTRLWAVVFHSYDRPIPTPIKGLRPARETCQECHWSAKPWGAQLYQRPHFRYDEKSTPEQIVMRMKVGGGDGQSGAGIHWHMAVQNEVTYVADDDHLQSIPWVRVTRPDGSATEYFRSDKPVDAAALPGMAHHTMDCMDCHNRPAHTFETPDLAIDRVLAAQIVSPTLPFVKSLSVDVLSKEYATRDLAHEGMARDVRAFYAERYPDVLTSRAADVGKLIDGLDAIYDQNVFPEMKVSWTTYPSNIGHRNSPGCFRCHDGKHVSPDGKVLFSSCDTCHTQPERGPQTGFGEAMTRVESDWHPWQTPEKHLKIEKHKNILCHECHVTGRRPKTECNSCHSH